MSVLDLRKAYLQVHVHRSLWPFQTMMVKEQRYCLTRMGFGLNVAPSIMQAIVETVLSNDVTVQQTTSAYIDDIFMNNCVAPAVPWRPACSWNAVMLSSKMRVCCDPRTTLTWPNSMRH